MITISSIMGSLLVIWSAVYTFSFGIWTWKKQNKSGAIVIFIIAVLSFSVPLYNFFIKK